MAAVKKEIENCALLLQPLPLSLLPHKHISMYHCRYSPYDCLSNCLYVLGALCLHCLCALIDCSYVALSQSVEKYKKKIKENEKNEHGMEKQ